MLTSTSASWVEAYHTGRGYTVEGISAVGFGTTGTNVGQLDLFVNGGNGQPGCTSQTNPLLLALCNHRYSWNFYAASITNSSEFGSCPCGAGLAGSCFYNSGCPLCSPTNPTCTSSTPTGYGVTYG